MEVSNIWWTHVSYNMNFIQNCINHLMKHNSLVLTFPKEIPFYDEMRSMLESKIKEIDAYRNIEYINSLDKEPGELLLEKFCKREKRAKYRKGIGYPKFLGESRDISLNQYYIWVTGIDGNSCRSWVNFISAYNRYVPKDVDPCLFILEYMGNESVLLQGSNSIKNVTYHYSTYDLYTYCSLLTSQYSMSTWKKHYICELVVNLCERNVELCYSLVSYQEQLMKNTYDVLNEVSKLEIDFKFLEKKIWESQLKQVFPRIESFRTNFIQNKYSELEICVPFLKACGKDVDNPFDIELGGLIFLLGEKKFNVNSIEYYEIENFRKARNALAHLKTIDYELLCKIMDR